MLDSGPVRLAAGAGTAGIPTPPTTPVPDDAVTVTTVTTGDPASNLPTRTWVVDNSADWDGSPGELVVLPRSRSPKDRGAK